MKVKLSSPNIESGKVERDHLTPRSVANIILQAGRAAGFEFEVRSHLLRHSCGYYLANKGYDTRLIQDYLGHANIQNTVRYTRLNANRTEVQLLRQKSKKLCILYKLPYR